MSVTTVLERLRQPEYTGENRCLPCSAVNVLIAVVLAAVTFAIAAPFGSTVAGLLTGGVFLASIGVIYVRGYLVPKTPWFTKTYFPDWLLRMFDKEVAPQPEEPVDDVDVEAFLQRVGAVTECADEDDLCLTDSFRTAWREQITRLRERDTTRDDLARILDIDPEPLTFEEFEDAFVARHDGRRVAQWESHAAFLADMAATNVLRNRYDGWERLDVVTRGNILNGIRIFLHECPDCGAPVTVGTDAVESCCRSIDVVVLTCQGCGARLFEAEEP